MFGFSFVNGVPATPEATEEMIRKIGFIRETQCKASMSSTLIYRIAHICGFCRRKVLGLHIGPSQR
jgi:hypothetical protein